MGRRQEELVERRATSTFTSARKQWDVIRHIDGEGKLVHELELASRGLLRVGDPTESIHEQSASIAAYPHIAVHDPQDIALGSTVCGAHVADFRVGAEVRDAAIRVLQVGVIFLDEDAGIEGGEFGY
jgi:hypothetical protein